MNRVEFVRSQVERAKRSAAMLTNTSDREKFQRAADDYQREIDALSAGETTSAHTKSADTSAPSDAIAGKSEPGTAAPSDTIAASNDGDAITSTNDTGPQKTD